MIAEKNETCYCDVEKTDVYKWRCITVIVSRGPQYRGVCKSGRRVQIGGGKVEPLDVSVQQDALREEELASGTEQRRCLLCSGDSFQAELHSVPSTSSVTSLGLMEP